jgi:hypothetical protein
MRSIHEYLKQYERMNKHSFYGTTGGKWNVCGMDIDNISIFLDFINGTEIFKKPFIYWLKY